MHGCVRSSFQHAAQGQRICGWETVLEVAVSYS